jgi:hypothetical protein
MSTKQNASTGSVDHDESGYDKFSADLILRFTEATKNGAKLFATNAEGVWDAFLAGFPEGAVRQYYDCHACRSFVEHFGGLVTCLSGSRTPQNR